MGEETSVDKEPQCHKEGSDEQGRAASPSINIDQGRYRHDDIENELDGRWKKYITS